MIVLHLFSSRCYMQMSVYRACHLNDCWKEPLFMTFYWIFLVSEFAYNKFKYNLISLIVLRIKYSRENWQMNKNVNSLIFKSLIDKKYSLVFFALVILFERVAVLTVPLIIGNFINNLLSLTLFQFQTYLKKVILKIIIIFFIQMLQFFIFFREK